MTTRRPWLLLVSLLAVLPAGAATLVVDDDNPCPGTGTAGDPFCSVQRAIDAAPTSGAGTTILVKPGLYQECLNAMVPVPKLIFLMAEDPDPNLTVLDGFSCFSVSTLVLGNGSTVTGFKISGGSEGAISSINTVIIAGNIITGNTAQGPGGGIFAESDPSLLAAPEQVSIGISNNTIQGNTTERDGGGIWITAAADLIPSGRADVLVIITNNTIKGNHASGVGAGIGGLTQAELATFAEIQITGNTVQSNTVDAAPGADADGFGGGIWVSTSGAGTETIAIRDNIVGPPLGSSDDTLKNTAVKNGGGISATLFAVDTAVHTLFITGNTVRRNTAALDGGGIDLFVTGDSLDPSATPPGRYSVLISDNDLQANRAAGFGGGLIADVGTTNTSAHRNPTDIVANRITNNVAASGGGGGEVDAFAEGGAATLCEISLRHNTVTGNSATNATPTDDAFGGGFSLFTQADGAGVARINAAYNTITGNTAEIGGGGIDLEGVTSSNNGGNGTTRIEISNSQITGNTGFGVGFPPDPDPPFPGIFRLILRSSDLSGNSEGPVESTVASHRVDVCMPAATAAERSFPGIDSDNDVDGIDLLRLATAFGSSPGAVHYNPLVDLDGDVDLDHVVDGNDLAILSASFGDTCP